MLVVKTVSGTDQYCLFDDRRDLSPMDGGYARNMLFGLATAGGYRLAVSYCGV
jgi:hypothetical protein